MGAATYIRFVPISPIDEFSALPVQIYDWSSRPQPEFQHVAAAGIVVLLTVLILLNATAVYVRYHYGRRVQW
jgi:phosphate transport system permease protein